MTIENETRIAQAPMVIIKGKINSLPLLGRTTLEELGMVKIDETGRLKEPNKPSSTCNIRKLQETQSSVDELLKPYQDLFHGIGRATRNGEEIQLHLPMDEEAEPVAQKPRRVAYHLMEPLQKRLQEFVEQDIMEKVPDQEPITWCSPMVVQPKPKNPNDIRLSLDLRTLNKSMLRTRQVQAPITKDFITAFKDCRIFSKLDLNHGYHQFVIDPQSRQAMTFSTPWGNYRYKRLAFGGVNSQDLFDGEMAKILSGIPRTLNNRDDIMIGGVDLADHDKNLKIVLGRLKDYNLTLRQEKCEFRKSTLEFHGHLFTAEGLKPSASKVRAVNTFQKPNTKEELLPLLPLLNNPKGKIPPRIERIIIKMQNLDFEAIHIPGKSNMTDYLSRHPLPETGKDHIEKHVNAAIQADHAIVWSKIKKATAEDKELCELTETIETGNWSEAKQF